VTAASSGSAPNGAGGTGAWDDFASAAPGEVRSRTSLTSLNPGPPPFGFSFSHASSASAAFDDFIITGPAGSVSTSLNLRFTGTLSSFGPQNAVGVTVSGDVAGAAFTGGLQLPPFGNATPSGFLVGQTGSEITTPTVSVPVNVPFHLSLALGTSASIVPPQGQGSNLFAAADYSKTLALSSQRPVFNLPAGYTVNSAEALVVNNTFLPEPGAVALICLAFPLLARRRRVWA
jgi:hypothetical protein